MLAHTGVGVLGGPLYAVGGHDGWSYLNTVERWDPMTKKWNYVAPMSTQRSTVGVAVLGKRSENVPIPSMTIKMIYQFIGIDLCHRFKNKRLFLVVVFFSPIITDFIKSCFSKEYMMIFIVLLIYQFFHLGN